MSEFDHSREIQHFEYEEKRQQVSDLEVMIADFKKTAADLDQQIKIEQQISGVTDVNHFAYSTYARAAMARRDNLRASVVDLEAHLEKARAALADAREALKITSAAEELAGVRQTKQGLRRKAPKGSSTDRRPVLPAK